MRIVPFRQRRRGAILPLSTVLIVVMLAFIALAVDLGYVMMVRSEMQNAADSAALAGASQLLDKRLLEGPARRAAAIAAVQQAARTEAQAFAQKNTGGGLALSLDANSSNDEGGDIVVGYLAQPSNLSQKLERTTMTSTQPPNSVQVIVHRDQTRNGSLGLFFARFFGRDSFDLRGEATATYEGGIRGFRIPPESTATTKLLPFALDVNIWNTLLLGAGVDKFSRDPATGTVTKGSDNIPETNLFPLSNGNGSGRSGLPPGNFGTLDIGSASNSTQDLSRQIRYGVNAEDLSYFPNGRLELSPATGTTTLQGDTGVSAGVKDDLIAIIGQPRIIPLYSTVSGPGNNARYTIVGFAGIVITEVVLTGSLASKHVTIQPCHVIDETSVGGGDSSTSYFVYKPLALTR